MIGSWWLTVVTIVWQRNAVSLILGWSEAPQASQESRSRAPKTREVKAQRGRSYDIMESYAPAPDQ